MAYNVVWNQYLYFAKSMPLNKSLFNLYFLYYKVAIQTVSETSMSRWLGSWKLGLGKLFD